MENYRAECAEVKSWNGTSTQPTCAKDGSMNYRPIQSLVLLGVVCVIKEVEMTEWNVCEQGVT